MQGKFTKPLSIHLATKSGSIIVTIITKCQSAAVFKCYCNKDNKVHKLLCTQVCYFSENRPKLIVAIIWKKGRDERENNDNPIESSKN